MNSSDHATAPAPIRLLAGASLILCALAPGAGSADPSVPAVTGASCAGTRAGSYLGCSAKDFTTSVVLSNSTDSSCTQGDDFYLDATVTMTSSGPNRYNIGFFTGENNNDPQANNAAATCSVATFPGTPYPWFRDSSSNSCGDFYATSTSIPTVRQIRVKCSPDVSGKLQVPYTVTWAQNDNDACSGGANVVPGTQSKCIGGTTSIGNVVVKPRPAAAWRFDESSWSGTTGGVADSGDNGINGTAMENVTTSGTTRAVTGSPGTCRYGLFDGDNDYVKIPSNAKLIGTNALAYTAWINPRPALLTLGKQMVISKSMDSGGAGRAQMGLYLDYTLAGVYLKGRAVTAAGPVEVSDYFGNLVIHGNLFAWSHVALVFTGTRLILYVNGSAVDTSTVASTTLVSNNDPLTIGNDWDEHYNFQGYIDEPRVYTAALNGDQVAAVMDETHTCPSTATPLDNLRIEHDGTAVSCNAENITVRACANGDCSAVYTGGVTGTLVAGANTVGFTIPANSASAVVAMHLPSDGTQADPQTISLSASAIAPDAANGIACKNTATGAVNGTTACDVSVYKAGFLFDVPNLTSGTASGAVTVSAVQSSNNNQCVPLFQNVTRNVAFWGNYANPTSGTYALLLNGNTIETTATPTYSSTVALAFNGNGQATLNSVRYDDVGQMQLNARYTGSIGNTPRDAGTVVPGSDTFVVKPHHFELSAIRCSTADATHCGAGALAMPTAGDNPGAADASGGTFIAAGIPFSVTVTSRNALNGATPNFGKESAPEGVKLSSALVSAGSTHNPAIGNNTAFGDFTDGVATGTNFTWGEVGIISLTPSIGDGDYLGAGDVTGTVSGKVGRFYPANFRLDLNQQASCGAFTYAGHKGSLKSGQPFKLSGTVTARDAANNTTQNYSGSYAKLTLASSMSATPMVSGAASGEAIWTNNGSLDFATTPGVGALIKNDLHYNFDAEAVPRNMYLHVTATDADGATGYEEDAAKTIEYRFGRVHLQNANGSEQLSLSIPFTTEYFAGTGYYMTNAQDGCTVPDLATELQLSNPGTASGAWQAGTKTMNVGSGTTAASLGSISAGTLPLSLTAPGTSGYVDIRTQTATNMPWLLSDWDGNGGFNEEATARGTFGLYRASRRQIYLRELY